jgi:sulfur carrier protein
MSTALKIQINGQPRTLEGVSSPATLPNVISGLSLKSDRIAVEHNGEIVPRSTWDRVSVSDGDRLEIVHFVGGGCLSQ